MIKSVNCRSLLLTTLLLSSGLTGCSTSLLDQLDFEDKDYSQLYLRGVFTWWEADEAFRVENVSGSLYKVTTNLVADGQPYEFKFVDREWSEHLNCGYANKETDEVITLSTPVEASCDGGQNNFKFTPKTSGDYSFFIDFSNPDKPLVYIKNA